MQEHRTFTGFFSYAHHDAETDPAVVKAFTTALEKRVNAELTNARFAIWCDTQELCAGEKWNKKLEEKLRGSDLLIVLLTPQWMHSNFCRKEYSIFEEVEAGRNAGQYYVLPILARPLDKQEKHFTPDQIDTYARLRERQYRQALVSDFLTFNEDRRKILIDEFADDIGGMIDRLRLPPKAHEPANRERISGRRVKDFDAAAQNFEKVDFVKAAVVVLDAAAHDGQCGIYAQIDFFERLYIQGMRGRIDFGVRRAFLIVGKNGPGTLSKVENLGIGRHNIYYVTLYDAREAVSICVDPQPGKAGLAELALPPAENQNYLSRIAMVSGDVKIEQLKVELVLSLNVEGLHLANEKFGVLLPRTQAHIKAIMDIAVAKVAAGHDESTVSNGQLRRRLPVKERAIDD